MTTPVVDATSVLGLTFLAGLQAGFQGAVYAVCVATLPETVVEGDEGPLTLREELKAFRQQCVTAAREGGASAWIGIWEDWQENLPVDREVFEELFCSFALYSNLCA